MRAAWSTEALAGARTAGAQPTFPHLVTQLLFFLFQVGLDELFHSTYLQEQAERAGALASGRATAACRAACRRGVPASQRPVVWACALGLPLYGPGDASSIASSAAAASHGVAARTAARRGATRPAAARGAGASAGAAASSAAPEAGAAAGLQAWCERDQQAFELLCRGVEAQPLLVDHLTCSDVEQVAESEHFFVFADSLRAMLLAFSRDASVPAACSATPCPRWVM